MQRRRSASDTCLNVAGLLFFLTPVSILLWIPFEAQPGETNSDLVVFVHILPFLLISGAMFLGVVWLFLRLSDQGASANSQATRSDAAVPITPKQSASAATVAPKQSAPATAIESSAEDDFADWHIRLIGGIVCWFLLLVGVAIAGPADDVLVNAYALLALPIAIGCLIISNRLRNTNLAKSIVVLKIPFYYGFGGIAVVWGVEILISIAGWSIRRFG